MSTPIASAMVAPRSWVRCAPEHCGLCSLPAPDASGSGSGGSGGGVASSGCRPAVPGSDRRTWERPAPVTPRMSPAPVPIWSPSEHDVTRLSHRPRPRLGATRPATTGRQVVAALASGSGGAGWQNRGSSGSARAGGAGTGRARSTGARPTPAVPFGGLYRLIDFALSNLVNAGILKIAVLTQYKSHSLDRHITTTWRLSNLLGNYVTTVPAQQRLGPRWYTGSADAILQSLNLINDERPDLVVVFGADHVYRMDPGQMWRQHLDGGAGVTVAGIPVPRQEATAFGVIQTADDGRRIEAFLEKPADPPALPGRPDETFASMGNYVFSTEALLDALRTDAADESSKHDMGGSIMPMLSATGDAWVYDFSTNVVPGATERDHGYWRDV